MGIHMGPMPCFQYWKSSSAAINVVAPLHMVCCCWAIQSCWQNQWQCHVPYASKPSLRKSSYDGGQVVGEGLRVGRKEGRSSSGGAYGINLYQDLISDFPSCFVPFLSLDVCHLHRWRRSHRQPEVLLNNIFTYPSLAFWLPLHHSALLAQLHAIAWWGMGLDS